LCYATKYSYLWYSRLPGDLRDAERVAAQNACSLLRERKYSKLEPMKLSRLLLLPWIKLIALLTGKNYFSIIQKLEYARGTSDHEEHNLNQALFSLMLEPAVAHCEGFQVPAVLDFGCGKGRNVLNLRNLGFSGRIIGVDISNSNITFCRSRFASDSEIFHVTNGLDMRAVQSESISSLISTIVFQHIPVWSTRNGLLKEAHRVLAPGGGIFLQMGYGPSLKTRSGGLLTPYSSDARAATGSNGTLDVQVQSEEQLEMHLKSIGFQNITSTVVPSFSDDQHESWIFVRATKSLT
jgi:ubiquinone/menaquinone biosynthesis C-methylase UbiE